MRSSDAALLPGPPRVAEVGCWSHVRRGFFDEWTAHQSKIAKEALDRIGALFDIERPIAGSPPDIRRAVRLRTARPRIDELATWLDERRPKDALSGRERSFHGESQVQDRPGCQANRMSSLVGSPVCKIMRQLPIENGCYLYRIKCVPEKGERVAKEGDLTLRSRDQEELATFRQPAAPPAPR